MVSQLNGHEFEQILGDSEGQGSLVCCNPWGCKESDMTEQMNNGNLNNAQRWSSRLQKEGIVASSGDARGCKVLVYTPYDTEVSTPEQSTFVPDEESSN